MMNTGCLATAERLDKGHARLGEYGWGLFLALAYFSTWLKQERHVNRLERKIELLSKHVGAAFIHGGDEVTLVAPSSKLM